MDGPNFTICGVPVMISKDVPVGEIRVSLQTMMDIEARFFASSKHIYAVYAEKEQAIDAAK